MRRHLIAAVLVLGLAGCSAQTHAYPTATAQLLRESVASVTQAAADGDPATALTRLDELHATLLDEHAKGAVDDARFDSISESIELVRIDLEALIADQNTGPTTNPVDPVKPGKPGRPDKPGKKD
jgi:predicted component of type VI protein secretion system